MKKLSALYLELSQKLIALEGVKWADLWHNQISFLDEELPIKSPACFLAFRTRAIEDTHKHTQQMIMQVEVYYFFETFAESFNGSINQGSAMAFLDTLTDIHVALHGSNGENYSQMRRTALHAVDTGSAQNLYRIVFECMVNDISAFTVSDDVTDDNGNGQNEPIKFTIDA